MVGDDKRIEFRKQNGLNSLEINNLKTAELVDLIETILKDSISNIMDKLKQYFPSIKNFGLNLQIAIIFELLDIIGFHKDEINEKSNSARLWDSNHTFFATYCDYFVTDDKKARKKADVIYSLYNIDTKIIDSLEFKKMINAK